MVTQIEEGVSVTYRAHFKDAMHDMDLLLQNKMENGRFELSFTIDEITFVGTSFDDFELKDISLYQRAAERFQIQKWEGSSKKTDGDGIVHFGYTLQRYELYIAIPISVRKRDSFALVDGMLEVSYILKEYDASRYQAIFTCDQERVYMDSIICQMFCLVVEDQSYCADNFSTDFESLFLQILKKCQKAYWPRCCFTCQYSDYSPVGNDDFGTMLCYKRHKERYLTINGKQDFFRKLHGLDFDMQQETNLCEEYARRGYGHGYRGLFQ